MTRLAPIDLQRSKGLKNVVQAKEAQLLTKAWVDLEGNLCIFVINEDTKDEIVGEITLNIERTGFGK
ncbi:MAG: hypothetical protein ACOX1G_04340 [bacterium]